MADGAVVALDISVLPGLPGLDVVVRDPLPDDPVAQRRADIWTPPKTGFFGRNASKRGGARGNECVLPGRGLGIE